ncbi:hypothetical protein O3P69_016438 [Scylla paramamosain]|uniref:Uncharacterized protein n=1 Tax=Scylla paramamosain TaxID=85552 RepID=A0AAW0TG97_SCYPA
MAQVEEITTDLLDKKYLFSGFVLGKAEWDAATLIKVYQRLLSVHSDGFDYEEVAPQAAHHLSHICKCLRLLGIGHLAPKSQDLVDKSRALRIISALDDKISAKYKPHIAARRIRVIIKKEQKSKSHKPKPRPPTGTVQEDSQESNQENVFPVVPLPKACAPQHSCVPEKTKPKAVQIKKSQPKASVPEAAQPPTVTPESPRDFIPSGRQLQRTPVATTAMQSDNLPTGSQFENDVHYKPEPSNTSETDHDVCCKNSVTMTSETDHDVCCKNSVTMTPVSSQPAHTSHRADNTYPCCTPEPVGDGVQSVLKECVLSHCSSEACIPPVPFSQDISPQSDRGVDVEAEVLAEEKPNIIPTGHQIPRTPKIPDKMLKLYLEEDTCSSNKEMTGTLEAQNTVSPLDLPERCRESDCTQGEENRSVEQETFHMASSEPSSPVQFPLEPIRMLHITSPTKSSADSPLPVDGGLPEHYVLSPPSGYKNNKTFSKTYSESLEGKCLAVQSEFSTLKSPPINHSLEDGCLQTNMTQVKVSYSKMLTTAIHDYESPPSSGSSCGNLTVQDSFSESPVSVVRNDNSSSSVLASVVINESSSSEATLSAESPASAISNNEGTFVCNTEGTYVLGDEGTFVCNTEATYVLGNEGTFVCNSEGTYMSDTEGTFSCKSEGTHMSDTEGTFSCKSEGTYDLDNEGTFIYSSEGTYVCSNGKTRITNNERTYVCNNKSMCDEPNNLEKLMKNISIENQDYSDSMLKHGAEDDRKHLIANEKDVSVLCENLELNCSLKENASPGGWDSEVNHTEQATPLVQNVTYIMSAKKLPGKTNHNEIKVESWKDVDDSSIIPKEYLSKKHQFREKHC